MTHSSGNHGQAVAWAADQCRLPCTVVVPRGTPQVKVDIVNPSTLFNKYFLQCDAIQGYGATLGRLK